MRNRALKFKVDAKSLSSDARIIKDFCEPTEHTSLRRHLFVVPISSKSFCTVLMPNAADSVAFSIAMCEKTRGLCRYIYRLAWR